jgi:hypothetical protein
MFPNKKKERKKGGIHVSGACVPLRGPLKISSTCCLNFFHASGTFVQFQSMCGYGIPEKSISA